jgi:hypothetical protein
MISLDTIPPCSAPTSTTTLTPHGFGVSWGPLVSAFIIALATTFDAMYLHPKQLCQRAPVMKLWDGTFRFAFLYRVPWLGPFLQSKRRDYMDILKAHRMQLPQPHQRSMFQVSREYAAYGDAAFCDLRAKIVQKFTKEEHSLFETPDGRFFTKRSCGVLMEITLDVRLRLLLGPSVRPGIDSYCALASTQLLTSGALLILKSDCFNGLTVVLSEVVHATYRCKHKRQF